MNKKTFHLGISMAGAISAGAYTAGVMDYLIEALDHWQKAKELQEKGKLKGVPKHDISIDVLSGASAGGMTAALTSAAIHKDFEPVTKKDIDNNTPNLKKNPLYHSWVNLTEEAGNDMMSQMLSTDDILNDKKDNPDKETYSVFNSTFIKTIAKRHIDEIVSDPGFNRKYFADDLEVFATLTNLRGIPFKDKFGTLAYNKVHRMKQHFDMAHFKLNPNEIYEEDGRIPLNFEGKDGCNKEVLVQSAMATGAFPIGLEPRVLKRLGKFIIDNKYINEYEQSNIQTINREDEYEALIVDGGTINNDPYIITKDILVERLSEKDKNGKPINKYIQENKTKVDEFEYAVVMIDPFPNDSDSPSTQYTPLKPFKFIIAKILSSMIDQLRMKRDQLKNAYEANDYTKYIIIPSRSGANKDIENYIACGSLSGFGGFFSKKFREHDFLLGRRNCQKFLRNHFSVPVEAENPILEFGYEDISPKDLEKYFAEEIKGINYIPLIPDIRVIENKGKYDVVHKNNFIEEKTVFPTINLSYILSLNDMLKKRFSILLKNIDNGKDPDAHKVKNPIVERIRKKAWYIRMFSGVKKTSKKFLLYLAQLWSKGQLAKKFIDMVITDMDKNELLVDDMNGH